MNFELLYILWNPSEVMFHIGNFGVRWYSMCWLMGLFLGYLLMKRLYKEQQIPDEKFDPLFIYIFVSVLVLFPLCRVVGPFLVVVIGVFFFRMVPLTMIVVLMAHPLVNQ